MGKEHHPYQLKVCGMRDYANIQSLIRLQPDYMGFIFYPGSKRYVGGQPDLKIFSEVPAAIKKTGVFVNESIDVLIRHVKTYDLQAVQLHGNESVDDCKALKDRLDVELIKSFPVQDVLPLDTMKSYEKVVDYFLLDTKTPGFGGSGQKFDWQVLEGYTLQKPVFLSGGIGPGYVQQIKTLNLPFIQVLDINSRFEIQPGMKNIENIQHFFSAIRKDDTTNE